MALYNPHSIFHLARLLYVRPEIFDPTTYNCDTAKFSPSLEKSALIASDTK